jgi:hypothetical protein
MKKPWSRARFKKIMRCIKRRYIVREDDLESYNFWTYHVMIKQLLALGYTWEL